MEYVVSRVNGFVVVDWRMALDEDVAVKAGACVLFIGRTPGAGRAGAC